MDIIIRTDSQDAPDAQDVQDTQGGACACGCDCCGAAAGPVAPAPTKDELIAKLKTLLGKSDANGQAQRQLDIDALIQQIDDLNDSIESD